MKNSFLEYVLPLLFAVGFLIGVALIPFGFPIWGIVLPIVVIVVYLWRKGLFNPDEIEENDEMENKNK